MQMVFGNLGSSSGTGVAFTRDPATGHSGEYGDYLPNAQGEDVVAGIRNTLSLADLKDLDPTSHTELLRIMGVLEAHYQDLCDIEFTIERGKLWMLQTRVGKRTAAAAFRIAAHLVDEGGQGWAGDDHQPYDGLYPTSVWGAGEMVRDTFTLTVPAGAPPGL